MIVTKHLYLLLQVNATKAWLKNSGRTLMEGKTEAVRITQQHSNRESYHLFQADNQMLA